MAEQREENATALAAQEREKNKDETEKGDRQIWHLRNKSSRMAFYKRVSNGSGVWKLIKALFLSFIF